MLAFDPDNRIPLEDVWEIISGVGLTSPLIIKIFAGYRTSQAG